MIGEPILDPREALIVDLEKSKEQFLAAGNSIQNIPTGISGVHSIRHTTGHHKTQQVARAKLARALREHADAGKTLRAAANAMKLKVERAQLIAKENGIFFKPL